MVNQAESNRIVKAVHGLKVASADPEFESGLSDFLRTTYERKNLIELYGQFTGDEDNNSFHALMRRAIWRAVARKFGNGVSIASNVGFKHLETFEIGSGVTIGSQSFIQGRFDGTCIIGDHVWIGPQSYFDARDLVIEEYVGWGPVCLRCWVRRIAFAGGFADHSNRPGYQAGAHPGLG